MKLRSFGAIAVILAALIPLAPVLLKGELPSFRDHEDYFVPLRAFTADALRAGEVPLWNPFNASGEPWLANPQTGVFYPPAWLHAILPFEVGYVAFLILHLVILGLGLRQLFLLWSSDAAATVVSATLIVSGPVLSLLDVSNNLATFAWIPWILARALGRNRAPGIGDSLLLALSFLGGEPLIAAVTWAAWALISLFKLGRSALSMIAWRLITATALSAVQLLPFISLLIGSDRAAGFAPEVAFRNSLAVADWLATIVSPAGVQPGIGRSQLFLPSIYMSPIIVFLALASVGSGVDKRVRAGWASVLIASMVLASGSEFPIVGWLLESMLLTVNRYPVKFALFGFVAIGVLCAIGFDRLQTLSTRARVGCGLAATCAFLVAQMIHRSDHAAIAITGLIVGLLWIAGFLVLLWLGRRFDAEARVLLACVLLPVVVVESVAASRFLLGSMPWPVPNAYIGVLDDEFRVMRLEQLDAVHTGASRARDRQAWMGGYLNLLSRQHDVSTAAPVLDRRYQELHDIAVSRPRTDLLDFFSVRYLFTQRDLSAWGYSRIAERSGVAVFERPGAHTMLTADFTPARVSDESVAFEQMMFRVPGAQEASTIAIGLEREYPPRAPDGANVRILGMSFSFSGVRAEVEISHPGLLVLNQKMREGWSVSVNGEPRRTVVANALFRGVELDRGLHEVEWRYRPRSFLVGIFVSLTAIVALVLEWWRSRAVQEKMSRSFHSELA